MTEPVEVLREMGRAFDEGDIGTLLSLLDEDVVWDNRGAKALGLENVYHGHEGLMELMQGVVEGFGDYAIDQRTEEARGDRVLVIARERAVGLASGATIDRPLAMVYEVRDGKVVRVSVHADVEEGRRLFESGA